jgi:hypothetical protein
LPVRTHGRESFIYLAHTELPAGWRVYSEDLRGETVWRYDWRDSGLDRGPSTANLYTSQEQATQVALTWVNVMATDEKVDQANGPDWPYDSKPSYTLANANAVGVYTREMYERACAAVELEPLSDNECDSYCIRYGDFGPPHYDAETIVSVDLARRRLAGLTIEAKRDDASALARGLAAAGGEGQAFTREQYERACAAARIEPLSDQGACGLFSAYLVNAYGPVKVIGFPADKDVAVELASRRADGVRAETADNVCEGCGRWLAPGEAMSASLGRTCLDCYDDLSG